MDVLSQPKSEALRRIYWRDEILELLFWIEGEGFGSEIDLHLLDRFLGRDAEIATLHLEPMVADGYLERGRPAVYRLSVRGRAEGRRLFAEEFGATHRPGHGACGAECWCQRAREEATACLAARRNPRP
jgi:hypothetical protein